MPWDDDLQTMIEQLDKWKEQQYLKLKAEHDLKHGEQLDLLAPVEGVDMRQVRDYLLQLNAIETVLSEIGEQRTALYQAMKDRGLPYRAIKAALKIARARQKVDSSEDVLEACIRLATSLLPEAEERTAQRPVPDMTGGTV